MLTRLVLTGLMISGVGSRLLAQTNTTISSAPSCKTCVVGLAPVAQLGSAEDSAGFGLFSSVVMTRRGQFLVSSETFVGQVFVYDRSGKYVRSIGRRGDGPGEFKSLLSLHVDAQDTVRVIEAGSAKRYHVIAPDNTVKRSVPVSATFAQAVVQPDGTLFVATPAGAAMVAEHDREGRRTKEIGRLPANANPRERPRFVAIGPDGNRWSLAQEAYVVDRWSSDGTRAQRLAAQRDWLSNRPVGASDARLIKPPARMLGLLAGPNGQLFVFAVVADANWKPNPPGSEPDPEKVFDTLVEVIDARSGNFITATRFDNLIFPMHGMLVSGTREDDVGDRKLHVWSISVVRK